MPGNDIYTGQSLSDAVGRKPEVAAGRDNNTYNTVVKNNPELGLHAAAAGIATAAPLADKSPEIKKTPAAAPSKLRI